MTTKSKIIVGIILLAVTASVGAYFYLRHQANSRPREYETAAVARGSIERIIVSTGTLDPVGSVEVGTQVSGTVDKVLVDFNDTVRAGQIIAEIDRSVLQSKLSEAHASLLRANALFMQSEQEFQRAEQLFEKGLISEQDFVSARTNFYSQRASLQVAQAGVNTAAENVRYATIRSPVRGTVISRNVDVGQTVAASLSAPTLFVIAEDLRKMKIMAQVDETDIGRIRAGQQVRFSVQAYPDKNYAGEVSQVRLQPEIQQNVVTYTVVILADNYDGTLLPGMTANVEFVEAREEDALTVPMAALRFQPPHVNIDSIMVAMGERREKRGEGGTAGAGDDEAKEKRAAGNNTEGNNREAREKKSGGEGRQGAARQGGQGGGREGRSGSGGRRAGTEVGSRAILWVLDDEGGFRPVRVRVGLNDGVRVAVVGGEDLFEGLRVVTGERRVDDARTGGGQSHRSILPQQQPQKRRP